MLLEMAFVLCIHLVILYPVDGNDQRWERLMDFKRGAFAHNSIAASNSSHNVLSANPRKPHLPQLGNPSIMLFPS